MGPCQRRAVAPPGYRSNHMRRTLREIVEFYRSL